MEQFLQRLPPKPRSPFVRLAITTGLVAFSFVLLLGLRQNHGVLGLFVLLPSIFLASLLFDRNAGIYASILSALLLYLLLTPSGSILLPRDLILPLLLFVLIAIGFAIVSEALRTAWERAAAAERAKDLLLQELGHRMKNNLFIITSILSMQMRLKTNPDTQRALEKAIARIHAIASAHEHFRPIDQDRWVEMRSYLEQLCHHLGDAFRELRPIAVVVNAAEVYLPPEQAVPVGLIVNELVTNSLKYAFPDDRAGTIEVTLTRESALTLAVKDDGIGCPGDRPERMGSRLIRLLAQQLGASVVWEQYTPGCHVRVTFPT
jgi:two-component sensor histidine kinase